MIEHDDDFRHFFETSLDLLCIADFNGYFTRINPAWTKTLGYSDEELRSRPYAEFIHPDDVAPTTAEAEKLSHGVVTIWFENRYLCKDGGYKWLLWQATPDVARKCIYAAARDITAHKAQEDTLKKVTEDLRRSNENLEQFAYVASHDLQEPLRMVTSYLQLLERRYKSRLDGDALQFIDFAVQGAGRMRALILGLLNYSRLGRRGVAFAPTDCEEVLSSACQNLIVSIEESGGVITHDPLPTVVADGMQLEQVFQNLIANALKFRGADPPRVHISARRDGQRWIFSVRDNGMGIDEAFFDRIFVIFQRLHTWEKYKGTGIGLPICKKIVERHGGTIWLESKPGCTTFYFSLPDDSANDPGA